ncbi:ArsR/SmtB family transcription factor [Vibrio gallicus]|uniref:ArsR/SmtB family transcription factor n=1 Tax=Vibrio gallicus TaxID=190897 RepID=UPI0021C45732|nr:metalloregulator ArsR/SmtB family transcription factor [Vibrio gallicus]
MTAKAMQVATTLKVLSHHERLLVLCQLIEGEKGVTELLKHSTLHQSALSQHLKVLRDNQLVAVRKEAQQVFYSLKDPRIRQLIESLYNIYCV